MTKFHTQIPDGGATDGRTERKRGRQHAHHAQRSQLQFRITPGHRQQLEQMAEHNGLSLSEAIEKLVENGLTGSVFKPIVNAVETALQQNQLHTEGLVRRFDAIATNIAVERTAEIAGLNQRCSDLTAENAALVRIVSNLSRGLLA
jgi:hypothetical protein